MEAQIRAILDDLEARGGMIECLRTGLVQRRIAERAYEWERRVQSGEQPVVGVNRFRAAAEEEVQLHRADPALEKAQQERLSQLRARRDARVVGGCLERLETAARGSENLMPYLLEAVGAYATVGEITTRLRRVFGEYSPPRDF
jgi:methylmalonyl-CoA mutase N-terminal domain/subunit